MSTFKMAKQVKYKKPSAVKAKESEIEKGILHFLKLKNIFAFKVKTTGTYDPVRKQFRSTPAHYMKGVADIIGIYNQTPLAIEVKGPKGYPSPEQKIFLERFKAEGGIAILARSIDDVNRGLREHADAKERDRLDQIEMEVDV